MFHVPCDGEYCICCLFSLRAYSRQSVYSIISWLWRNPCKISTCRAAGTDHALVFPFRDMVVFREEKKSRTARFPFPTIPFPLAPFLHGETGETKGKPPAPLLLKLALTIKCATTYNMKIEVRAIVILVKRHFLHDTIILTVSWSYMCSWKCICAWIVLITHWEARVDVTEPPMSPLERSIAMKPFSTTPLHAALQP